MTLGELVRHPLFVAGVSLVGGAIITSVVTRVRNKLRRIGYHITVAPIGLSTNDPVFGDVRITLNQNEMRNLYLATVEIENQSRFDIENLDLKVYVEQNTLLLTERTGIVNTPFIVPWSQFYAQTLTVPEGQSPTPEQWSLFQHSREYHLTAFNRYQQARLIYLCTRPSDDVVPSIWVDSPTKGVRVKQLPIPTASSGPIFGVPVRKAVWPGLWTAIIIAVYGSLFVHWPWVASVLSLVSGLAATAIGALEYRVFDFLRKKLNS